MSIKNIKKLQAEKGFTIVELLIVIVIIGILAAIVIVAFNGITQRANANAARSNAAGVLKVADTFNAECPKTGACTSASGYPTSALLNTYSAHASSSASLPNGVTLQATAVTSTHADGKTLTYVPKGTSGVCIGYWDQQANAIAWIYGGNATGTAPSGSPLVCP